MAETPREADFLAGYAVGVIMEKYDDRKLTRSAAEAIAQMAEAVGEGKRRELVALIRGKEPEPDETPVIQFADFQEAADGGTENE